MLKLAMSSAGRRWPYAGAAVLVLPALCMATDVRVVAVTPGQSADVVIDRGAPVTIEVGEVVEGVKLLKVDRASAVLTVNGTTRTLPLAADVGSLSDAVGGSVTLLADARGQFFTSGTVNRRPMHFIVDTGATLTTLSRADARRIGLDYRGGQRQLAGGAARHELPRSLRHASTGLDARAAASPLSRPSPVCRS